MSNFDDQFSRLEGMIRWLLPVAVIGGLLLAAGLVGAIIYGISKL